MGTTKTPISFKEGLERVVVQGKYIDMGTLPTFTVEEEELLKKILSLTVQPCSPSRVLPTRVLPSRVLFAKKVPCSFVSRRACVVRFLEKRKKRVWTKTNNKYSKRTVFANSRLRVKGMFIRKEEEMLLRELINLI